MREWDSDRILRAVGGEPDLLSGGPPCQSWSQAGVQRGLWDPRGLLLHDFVERALDVRPRFLILENVVGLRGAPIRRPPRGQRPSHPEEGVRQRARVRGRGAAEVGGVAAGGRRPLLGGLRHRSVEAQAHRGGEPRRGAPWGRRPRPRGDRPPDPRGRRGAAPTPHAVGRHRGGAGGPPHPLLPPARAHHGVHPGGGRLAGSPG